MSWRGQLLLRYTREGGRTVALDRHEGPLRVLQRLYPEGEAICHHVLVHPPGGIVGGDVLEIDATLAPGTHAVLTTPGATRFYRSAGEQALQVARLHVAGGARLEWLPLETLAYSGCLAENRVEFTLDHGAQALGWDVLALGLPAAGEPFARGHFVQHLQWPGHWLERGRVDASDTRLLDSPLGWAGRRVCATLWLAGGPSLPAPLREALLEAARARIDEAGPAVPAGVTCPNDGVVVLRALGERVEPVMALLVQVRAAWREQAWGLADERPRVWRT